MPLGSRREGHASPAFVAFALGVLLLLRYRVRLGAALHLWRVCHGNDLRATRDAILTWSAHLCPHAPALSVAALAERSTNSALRDTLKKLDHALYGPGSATENIAQRRALQRALPSLMMEKFPPLSPEGNS